MATDARRITDGEIRRLLIAKTGADPGIFAGADEISLEALGIDSLAVLELQATVSDMYGLRIPEDALQMTVNEITMQVNDQTAGA